MSIRHLDQLFDPASIAVIGASQRPASVGATVWRNLHSGGFKGRVFAVNPKYREFDGMPVFAQPADLPEVPDLAVICTPPAAVPGLIAGLGKLGTRAAVVLSAGLDAEQNQAMLDAANPYLLRVLGPNCLGMLSPHAGLNASFAHVDALPGELAFITQSGALMTAMLDWARSRRIGFSHLVSLGEHADVDFGDMLDYLSTDPHTRAILLYIESVEAARKFMSAARGAARNKPVIVVKSGRSAQGQRAAASHTGALAGSDLVYDAAIARAGMLRVDTMQQLFLAAETLARFRDNVGEQLAILTNGGGAGVMAADYAAHLGVDLCELDPATVARLDVQMPANWSRGNPVDIIGDAPAERYVQALEALNADPGAGAVLFMHAPTAIVPSADIARALVPLASRSPPRVMGCWMGDESVAEARAIFRAAGIAGYETPEQAVRAFSMLTTYRRNQAQLIEAAPVRPPGVPDADIDAVNVLIRKVLGSGRDMLTEPEAKVVLSAYAIPVVATRSVAADPAEAAQAAISIGFPVALKILSPDISHKSDVGGVALNLADPEDVRSSATAMLERVHSTRPTARIEGFAVQAMIRCTDAQELIVGASIDNVFGPVILFGQGGTAVEVLADRAIALPPLNLPLARALVARTRVASLLKGFRNTPPADLNAVYSVLMAVSQLLADNACIAELDINPLIVNHKGAIALDARIRLSSAAPGGALNFAIRPYPAQLIESLPWMGRELILRPIRPEDEQQHLEFLAHLDPEDVRQRVFYSKRTIERSELARLTQIDYARETAFIAVAAGPDGCEQTLGVVRATADPDNCEAEFAIIVRSDVKGQGLGELLIGKLIRTLRVQGTRVLVASMLLENTRMLELARSLGFREEPVQSKPGFCRIRKEL